MSGDNLAARRQLMELAYTGAKIRGQDGVVALLAIPQILEVLLNAVCSEKVRIHVAIGDAEVAQLEAAMGVKP